MEFGAFEEGSVINGIDEACDRWPDRACFLFRGVETSYRTVKERSIQVANQLLAAGFEKEMRGAVFSPNDPEAFIAALGVIRAGGIWPPINPRNSVADNCALLGGFNVYSTEVERVISTLPGVRDNVVIGVPDEKWGEAVKAVVELDPEARLEARAIVEACKAQLGSVKAPKSVDFVDALPKNANGKVLKREVRERYWKGVGRRV